MAMPLGMTLVGVQMLSARNDMFSNVSVYFTLIGHPLIFHIAMFEIAIATLISFIAAALAATRVFCYTALVSGGVVLILPVSVVQP